ncbi:MAG: 6-bladed beta-propeller [Gammaproteobacteria bacterium]|nr:6-bladed beta-propeller [Gammaproteobacteria bacterium]
MLLLTVLLTACGETKYLLRYETPSSEKIWPPPPDTPRFRYIGQLTGEPNLERVEKKGSSEAIYGFFRALVGLGRANNKRAKTLLRPQGGASDSQGRIVVSDAGRQAVFVFDEKQGSVDVFREAGKVLNFVSPVGVAIAKNGDILVADAELRRVIRLGANGVPKGEFGFTDLERPTGLAIDPATERVFVADTEEHNVKVFNSQGKLVQIIGKVGVGNGEFNAPTHVAFIGGFLYVTDTFNARIQVFDAQGEYLKTVGERGGYLGNLVRPKGVTADTDGNIYIIESFHDYLLVYDKDARFLLPIGGTGSGVGQFYLPAGVWSDARNRIYVADMFNGRVVIFQYIKEPSQKESDAAGKTKVGKRDS